MMFFDIGLDLFPLLAAVFAAVSCALLGNFLVLRRLSLMGDAISHSVLPGLVIAFLITSTRSPLVMFAGAAIAGMATVVLVEFVKRFGRVESGAAMGVVFSILFALGVLLIEQAAARHVDLDADCVLHGQLETLVWYSAPQSWDEATQLRTWTGYIIEPAVIDPATGGVLQPAKKHEGVPRPVSTLAITLFLTVGFVTLLFKELRLAAFDSALATTLGFNASLLHYLLMVFVAVATVASFEAVGSILVIAMLICPAAVARLFTDRLGSQMICSVIVALISSIGGYFSATMIPSVFGIDAVNAAGAMAMMGGLVLTIAVFLAPSHGVISRVIRRRRLSSRVALDDLLAGLYRAYEHGQQEPTRAQIQLSFTHPNLHTTIKRAARLQLVEPIGTGVVQLTEAGMQSAREVVRRHRLWEHYLVEKAGLAPDHVHETAELLEHLTSYPPQGPASDPHGKTIPPKIDGDIS